MSDTQAQARLATFSAMRGFGPAGIAAMLVILLAGNFTTGNMVVFPAGGLLVLAWAWLSGTPWSAIGYVRPNRWLATVAGGIALGIALKIAMKALVMPLFGANPVNPVYHFLAGNRSMLPPAVWAMLVAGFGEETVFRGYLFERGGRLFGGSKASRALIVVATAALFGLAHYPDQGLAGAEQGAVVGLIFGSIFAVTGRIFFLMFAHSAFDLTALAMIYWNLEARVAHWVFK